MKKIVVILMLSLVGIGVKAVNQTFVATQPTPAATMQSVNGTGAMSTGSAYSSDVYEVGSQSPTSGPHRAKMDGDDFPVLDPSKPTTDPNNPQYGPLGDAVLPFTLLSMVAAGVVYLRRRKQQA